MFVSYEETKKRLSEVDQKRVVVTGNPVRPVFYKTDDAKGREFLGIGTGTGRSLETGSDGVTVSDGTKPVLLVLGGSSGAK
jgi:UDP-N-acetylglucosamine--N-acetylmuramyl-(pentapeptide) pyrophosphoryl-undecaprenol N-acetylglucosamine transferase